MKNIDYLLVVKEELAHFYSGTKLVVDQEPRAPRADWRCNEGWLDSKSTAAFPPLFRGGFRSESLLQSRARTMCISVYVH